MSAVLRDMGSSAVLRGMGSGTVLRGTGLLKIMPHMNDAVALVRAWLSRSLRGNAPPRRIADT